MNSVRKLDENHPDIICHGQDHFADAFCLSGFRAPKGQTTQLGNTLHNTGNLWTKHLCQFLGSPLGIH